MKSQTDENKEIFEVKIKYYWENADNHRYYMAHAYQDLLGDWVAAVCWGRKNTKLGRLKSLFCENEMVAIECLEKLDKIRCYHGYSRMKDKVLRHDFSKIS